MMELMRVCVCSHGFLCGHERVSNGKRGRDAEDVVTRVIVPSLASPHLVEWCSGFDQHSLNRSQFVFHRV